MPISFHDKGFTMPSNEIPYLRFNVKMISPDGKEKELINTEKDGIIDKAVSIKILSGLSVKK